MARRALTEVKGIGPSTAGALSEHGISSAEDLAQATVEAIAAVPGFSQARAVSMKKAAEELLAGVAVAAPSKRSTPVGEIQVASAKGGEKEKPKKPKKDKKDKKGKKDKKKKKGKKK